MEAQMAGMLSTRALPIMSSPDPFERFASEILSADISAAARLRFQALARCATVASGEAALCDGEEDRIVFIAAGATKLVAHASQGREQVVAFHFAGDLVSLPARGAHAYTLCALEDCELLTFPARDFFRLAREEVGVIDQVLERALRALGRSREKSIMLGRKTAQERVAGFLVSIAERIGAPQGGHCELELPMSRRDIADSLGLTIETVSRQFGRLRELGLLETSGRSGVRLPDIAALEARAGHLAAAA